MTSEKLPCFSALEQDNFADKLDALLQSHLADVETLLQSSAWTWETLMMPLEAMDDALERFWSPMSHLHAVLNSPQRRACYQACLPKLSAYEAAMGQNERLYHAIESIPQDALNPIQKKIIADALLDFELTGVALPADKKKRFETIDARLSVLCNEFENHVLDATQAFQLTITDEKRLQGLPAHAIETARSLAEKQGVEGFILTLEFPCYSAVITYADDRALRETFYEAYVTRASDQGPWAGKFDNTAIINEILALRHETAQLLGFSDYAQYSLATKMANSTQQVVNFLQDLVTRARQQALLEVDALKAFVTTHTTLDILQPWDIAYWSEKMCEARFSISQEVLRPYFPEDTVLSGIFSIVDSLYGITLEPVAGVDVWNPDVLCYRVKDKDTTTRGFIYLDLYARLNKRGGAWMDSLQSRRRLEDGSIQLPIATLTCNFAKTSTHPVAILSHDEVVTLFHELGHCLHHVLTQVDYISASGINGVEWDAVELPSQFFEHWAWEKNALGRLTRHVETNEQLPEALYEKLLAAKNFQSAVAMMRQLEFSLFDFRMHENYEAHPDWVVRLLAETRKDTAILPVAPYNRFQHSFTHIFAGGYAAGYYSYKWAEVLSSDAYARFEEEGVFNQTTGLDFLKSVLEAGGSMKAMDAFVAFRGREATIDALLRHNGIF